MSDRLIDITGGYGSVYKKVMKDTELSIEAKAIYAYLTSYAGGKDTAFPSVSLICHELNISKNRFYNHRKELVEKEIISVNRERTDNGFSKNIYTINHHFVRLNFVDIQNVDIQNVDIQNKDTKNNSVKNNSIKNNNNTSDVTAKTFEYISNNLEMIQSPLKIDEIEYEINLIKDDAYEITKVAVDYCKEKNKGIPYLITILKNWNKEGIDTVEKAKAKAAPKKRKQPKKETDNFLERKRQELMGG
ncbi:DnaD-like helicase loader [Staphylococcus phage phiRS7]|uniref:DnaD-like helicase loader n=1 Tax=Staphylococcus phage phiRS7 TaxID=1403390 RepID=UPI0003B09E5C|nr:helix-turn-helix domain-containing protein [Staphylococcus saprophyticus]YP_008853764.1 DnaD-like helicase loader [Staphylococcus phage phiRS7]AGW43777.1 DnaD and phage-associated domain protein [Staphylococcus phage phiRS7]MDW4045961.1 helix-turn-helix domain-containing protein [Staphylococcus saprophyticus]